MFPLSINCPSYKLGLDVAQFLPCRHFLRVLFIRILVKGTSHFKKIILIKNNILPCPWLPGNNYVPSLKLLFSCSLSAFFVCPDKEMDNKERKNAFVSMTDVSVACQIN